jgi:putative flippase GtrA
MNLDIRAIKRFVKYSSIGFGTFILDLALLWFMVEILKLNYLIATGIAFFIAVSINYLISRKVVFNLTKTSFLTAYVRFLSVAGLGVLLTVSGVALLSAALGVHYLLARVLTAGGVGIFNYTINLYYNFKVAGIYK